MLMRELPGWITGNSRPPALLPDVFATRESLQAKSQENVSRKVRAGEQLSPGFDGAQLHEQNEKCRRTPWVGRSRKTGKAQH